MAVKQKEILVTTTQTREILDHKLISSRFILHEIKVVNHISCFESWNSYKKSLNILTCISPKKLCELKHHYREGHYNIILY